MPWNRSGAKGRFSNILLRQPKGPRPALVKSQTGKGPLSSPGMASCATGPGRPATGQLFLEKPQEAELATPPATPLPLSRLRGPGSCPVDGTAGQKHPSPSPPAQEVDLADFLRTL